MDAPGGGRKKAAVTDGGERDGQSSDKSFFQSASTAS